MKRKNFFAILLLLSLACCTSVNAATSGNLIQNPSVEIVSPTNPNIPTGWVKNSWGSNTATFTYLNTSASEGQRSLSITLSNYVSGDAKWYFSPVVVKPSTSYTFSDFYIATVKTEVMAQYTLLDGGVSYVWLGSAVASTSWRNATVTFVTPANIKSVSIFHLINKNGTLKTDNFSLVEDLPLPTPTVTPTVPPSPTPTPVSENLVPNSSFEIKNPNNVNLPLSWSKIKEGRNTSSFSYLTTGYSGGRSVKMQISKYTSGSLYYKYKSQPVDGGKKYIYSDYYKSNTYTEVDAEVAFSDGRVEYIYLGSVVPSTSWTKFSARFEVPFGAVSMTVYHSISSVGYLICDDVSLFLAPQPVPFQRAMVSLTFDDMYDSFYNYAFPLFKKYNASGTLYITSQDFDVPGMMNKQKLLEMGAYGLEFGSHTVTHPHLTTLSLVEAENELKTSKEQIESYLGMPITSFASPYGEYNQQVVEVMRKYYTSHRSTDIGTNSKEMLDAYNIHAESVVSTTPIETVLGWIDQAIRDKAWLSIVYHDVRPDDGSGFLWTTTPEDLEAVLKKLHNNNIATISVSEALLEAESQ